MNTVAAAPPGRSTLADDLKDRHIQFAIAEGFPDGHLSQQLGTYSSIRLFSLQSETGSRAGLPAVLPGFGLPPLGLNPTTAMPTAAINGQTGNCNSEETRLPLMHGAFGASFPPTPAE
jgi:hypothetical protein